MHRPYQCALMCLLLFAKIFLCLSRSLVVVSVPHGPLETPSAPFIRCRCPIPSPPSYSFDFAVRPVSQMPFHWFSAWSPSYCLIHVLLFSKVSFQATRTIGLPNLLPSDNLKIWQAAAGLEQTSWLECHGAGSALCQCPMCYVPKCFVPYASILCAMYLCAMSYVLSMHLSAKGYACALCHPSPTLQGARNCEPRKNQVWNCQVVERCATKTQIHTCTCTYVNSNTHRL